MFSNHFIIEQAEDGFNVFGRTLVSRNELAARKADLAKNGWPEAEAEHELRQLEVLRTMTEAPVPMALALDYIFNFGGPGDVLQVGDHVFLLSSVGFA